MKLICGLGNPGLRYKSTRHNIGFMAIDNFAKINGIKINKKGFNALFARAVSGDEDIVLLKPQTFMNNSGSAVKEAAGRFGVGPEDVLVICDDVNLELGIIRLRPQGSAGGHKGLISVINALKTQEFNRLRVGVGQEKSDILKDYVLSGFKSGDKKALKETIDRAADAISDWIENGIETAMNRFNTKNT